MANLTRPTNSLVNNIYAAQTNGAPVPVVGMGCTLLGWTDRHPATVIAVSSNGRTIEIQEDTATRTDKNGMSEYQTYEYSRNESGSKHTYTLRKNGAWVRQGEGLRNGSHLRMGERNKYHDYSF